MATYSLAQIRNSLGPKKDWEKQYPLSTWIVRPISFHLAYWILKVTRSPSTIALAGFCLGLVSCLLFALLPYASIWAAIGFLGFYDMLDAVDGTVARTTRKVTYFGKFLDGLIGEIVEGSYAFCLGLGLYWEQTAGSESHTFLAWRDSEPAVLLLACVLITFGKHYCTIIQSSYYRLLRSSRADQMQVEESLDSDVQSSRFRRNLAYLLFENINTFDAQVFSLVLAAALSALDIFLLFYALYYSVRFCVFLGFYYYRASRTLRTTKVMVRD